jgi:hypothetical protein
MYPWPSVERPRAKLVGKLDVLSRECAKGVQCWGVQAGGAAGAVVVAAQSGLAARPGALPAAPAARPGTGALQPHISFRDRRNTTVIFTSTFNTRY